METIVYAEIHVSGCYASLTLNGIPLLSTGRFGAVMSSMPVRQFLIVGTNQLELLVEPLPEPSRARTEERKLTLADKWAVGRLVRYEDGVPALVENGTILLEHHWAADGNEDTYPKILRGSVLVPEATHHWDWEDVPSMQLDETLIAEAVSVLESLADTIRRADLDAFMAATEAKIRDVMRAYPVRTEESIRDELGQFLRFWQSAGDPLYPLNADAHDFRLAAGGRLLTMTDRDGLGSLRFRDPTDQSAIPYPLYLSRLGGRLQVVR